MARERNKRGRFISLTAGLFYRFCPELSRHVSQERSHGSECSRPPWWPQAGTASSVTHWVVVDLRERLCASHRWFRTRPPPTTHPPCHFLPVTSSSPPQGRPPFLSLSRHNEAASCLERPRPASASYVTSCLAPLTPTPPPPPISFPFQEMNKMLKVQSASCVTDPLVPVP